MRRRANGHRLAAGALGIAALILASCTSGSAGVHLQTADPPPPSTSTKVTSSPLTAATATPPQTAVSSAHTSDAGTGLSSRSSTTTAATNSEVKPTTPLAAGPWPATFTPAQRTAAIASLGAVRGYIQIEAEANAKPGAKDWTIEVRRYTADPAAYLALRGIASLASAKVHATTPPSYQALTVKSADAHRVTITACVDRTKADLVDASGKSVITPPAHPRSIEEFTASLFSAKDGGWLVSNTVVLNPVQTC